MFFKSFIYSLKVWLTSVVIIPLIFLISVSFGQNLSKENIYEQIYRSAYLYGQILVIELIASFITWVVFLIIIQLTVIYCNTRIIRLSIISISGIFLTIGTFLLILPPSAYTVFNIISDNGGLLVCTCFCIGAGSWFYKLDLS